MSSVTLTPGRYQLQDRISAGGMGEVGRGVDAVLEDLVAVKLLHAEYACRSEAAARLRDAMTGGAAGAFSPGTGAAGPTLAEIPLPGAAMERLRSGNAERKRGSVLSVLSVAVQSAMTIRGPPQARPRPSRPPSKSVSDLDLGSRAGTPCPSSC